MNRFEIIFQMVQLVATLITTLLQLKFPQKQVIEIHKGNAVSSKPKTANKQKKYNIFGICILIVQLLLLAISIYFYYA